MSQATRGIVLRYFNYSDSSIIVKIFTEVFGLQSYMIRGIYSKKTQTKLAVFQPLNIIGFITTHRESKSLQNLKEPKVEFHYQSIHLDPLKRSVLFFLAELLYKTIQVEAPDQQLFRWLYNALTWYDLNDERNVNFHLVFMIQLSRFLGIYPKYDMKEKAEFFDLADGKFTPTQPNHPQYAHGLTVEQLFGLCNTTFEDSMHFAIQTTDRRKVLDSLITYYQLHIPEFGEMKTVSVLKEII